MGYPPVWYAIPSARPDGGTLKLWHERGYKVAVWRDPGADLLDFAAINYQDEYPGYAKTVNSLCFQILKAHPETKVIVTGGDDIDPDPKWDPLDIQSVFETNFPDLYGVMQPTGDRWMFDEEWRSCSERVAYSPWMGRAWCLEANQGTGPIWHEYFHHFEDEDLQLSAIRQGAFWQVPSVVQHHHHWMREGNRQRPEHLQRIDTQPRWKAAKALFEKRKAAGFPGSERKR